MSEYQSNIKKFRTLFHSNQIATFPFTLKLEPIKEKFKKILTNLPNKHQQIKFTNSLCSSDSKQNAYGIVLGKLIVLDIDNKIETNIMNGMEWLSTIPPIDTFCVDSISGGKHFYFWINDITKDWTNKTALTINGIKIAIDIKTTGGFIIGPGSYGVFKNKTYSYSTMDDFNKIKEMPEWLIKLLTISKPVISTIIHSIENTFKPSNSQTGEIEILLDNLSLERSINYDDWRNIAFALYDHACVTGSDKKIYFEFFNNFSKKCKEKYDLKSCEKMWSSIKPRDKNKITIKTLYSMLKNDNLDVFYSLFKKRKKKCLDYINPHASFEQENIISINKQFLEELPYENIIVKSHMGSNKTTCIRNIIDQYNPSTILILSPRQIFAKNITCDFKKFNFACYLDLDSEIFTDEIEMSNRLVISMESLYKLYDTHFSKRIDYLIIDECESCFTQFYSTTMKNRLRENVNMFEKIVKNAEKIVMTDAFLSNRTVKICNSLGLKYTFIQNTFQPLLRKAIRLPMTKLKNNKYYPLALFRKLISLLKNGYKIYFVCGSVKRLTEFEEMVKKEIKDIRYKIYHAESKNFADFENVDKTWSECQLVMTTTTITVGINYYREYFDYAALYGVSGGGLVRDLFQALMRVRNLIKNTIYYSVNPLQIKGSFITPEEVSTSQKYIEMVKEELALQLNVDTEPLTSHKWLKENLVWCELEKNINDSFFNEHFHHYLEFCGYEIEIEDIEDVCEMVIEKVKGKYKFEDIKVPKDISSVINKVLNGENSELDSAIINKANFLMKFRSFKKLPDEIREVIKDVFNDVYVEGNKQILTFFDNVISSVKYSDDYDLKNELKFNDEMVNTKLIQINIIKQVCKDIGINDFLDDRVINLNDIDGVKLQNDIKNVFKLRCRNKNEGDKAEVIANLRKLVYSWSGGTLTMNRKQKRITGKVVDTSEFYITPLKQINQLKTYIKIT